MNYASSLFSEDSGLAVSHIVFAEPDPTDFPPHSHFYWEILYFIEGDVSYTSGEETVRLSPDTLILSPPHLLHSINVERGAVYERYNMIVKSEELAGKIMKHSRHVYMCSGNQIIKNTFRRFDLYASLFRTDSEEFHSVAKTVAEELIFLINHLNMPEISGNASEGDLSRRAAAYVEEHLTEIRSVNEIAEALYLSRATLFAIFKTYYKKTPHCYLTSRRLSFALQKMKEGVPAAEAAKLSGFSDYPVFYRAFRRQFGKSPRDFRLIVAPSEALF